MPLLPGEGSTQMSRGRCDRVTQVGRVEHVYCQSWGRGPDPGVRGHSPAPPPPQ